MDKQTLEYRKKQLGQVERLVELKGLIYPKEMCIRASIGKTTNWLDITEKELAMIITILTTDTEE